MPKSKDLYLRSAYQVIKQQGLGAEAHAMGKIIGSLNKKNVRSAQNWLMTLKWIKEIQIVIPPADSKLVGHRPRETKPELIFTRDNLLELITEYQKETKLSIMGGKKKLDCLRAP